MTKLEHNGLVIDIPKGWSDATVLTLLGPPPPPPTPLSPRAPRREPPSIVVKEVPADDWGGDLEAFVRTQDEILTFALSDIEITERTTEALGGDRDAVVRACRFGPADDRLRQIFYFVPRGSRLFVVCATAPDDLNFAAVGKAARAVATDVTRLTD